MQIAAGLGISVLVGLALVVILYVGVCFFAICLSFPFCGGRQLQKHQRGDLAHNAGYAESIHLLPEQYQPEQRGGHRLKGGGNGRTAGGDGFQRGGVQPLRRQRAHQPQPEVGGQRTGACQDIGNARQLTLRRRVNTRLAAALKRNM